jgi:Zn-dependent peptidase ImmA (M78 family)/DNA-binding XRE family transcriptional regulator
MLVWARGCGEMVLEQAAEKLRVEPQQLASWESGESNPTIPQLRHIANVYKKPIAAFYMTEPPQHFTLTQDFRRIAEAGVVPLSSELSYEVDDAHERREKAIDLYQELGLDLPELAYSFERTQDREQAGKQVRQLLDISRDVQLHCYSEHDAFRMWKQGLEKFGILVFQALDVDTEEMRGFSIASLPLPVIDVNGKDAVTARTFTMMHEFMHILLRVGGLCDLSESTGNAEKKSIEQFCNGVAGAALVPQEYLMLEEPVLGIPKYTDWPDIEINELAYKYKVSREVIMRRLLICDRITIDFYREKREQYRREFHQKPSGGYPSPARNATRSLGDSFIRLVFEAYNVRKITLSDMSDYLGVKTKHFRRIEAEVFGREL